MGTVICPGCNKHKTIKPIKRGARFRCSCGCRESFILMRAKVSDREGMPPDEAKRASLAGLRRYGDHKGFKPGWAACKFRVLWGHWPNGIEVEPAPCPVGLLAWIKRQGKAWAKEKRAREAESPHWADPVADLSSSSLMTAEDWSVRL